MYGTCSDIHDSKVLEQSIRDNAPNWRKWWIAGPTNCGGFPSAS